MPKVTIPGVGEVQYPDSMSDKDIMRHAQDLQEKTLAPKAPMFDARDLPASELFKGAFSRGIEGLKGTAFDLIPALAGSVTGHDQYAQEQMKEYQDRMAAAEAENPTAYNKLSDIKGIGDLPGFVAETAGMLAPDALSFIAGTGVGTTLGKYAARKGAEKVLEKSALEYAAKKGLTGEAADTAVEAFKNRAIGQNVISNATEHGASIGTNLGLTSTSMAINVPDVLQSVYQDTGELHPGIALTVGPIVGALDTIFPAHIVKQLGSTGKKILAKELLDKSTVVPTTWKKAFGKELLKDVSMESLTEGTQQALQVAASQMAGDKKKFFDPNNIDSIIMASIQGAIGAGSMGAIPSAIQAKGIKAQSEQDAAAQKAQAALDAQKAQPPAPPLTLGYTSPPAMQQVETDQSKRPIEVSPGITYDPTTGLHTIQQQEEQPGRTVNPLMNMPQPNPELVGQGAPNVELNPAQQEMFGTTAFEKRQPSIDSALAGPPEAPTEFSSKLDAETLKGTGLKPQSGFFKQLLDKDMSKPKQQAAVADILINVRKNPNLSDSTKNAVEAVAMQAFGALAKQQEMFTPLGNVRKDASYAGVQPTVQSKPISTTNRTGIQVPNESVPNQPAGGVTAPQQRRVAPVTEPTAQSAVRETVQPSALSQEDQDALQAELQAEMAGQQPTQQMGTTPQAATTPAQESIVGTNQGIPQVAGVAQSQPVAKTSATQTLAPALIPHSAKDILKQAEQEKARREKLAEEGNPEFQELGRAGTGEFDVSKGYMGFAKEDVKNIDDSIAVTDLLRGATLTPIAKAAKTYFGKMPRLVDNLINVAFDIAFNPPRFRVEGESNREAKFFQGMNGASARLAADWIHKNLSPDTDKQFRDFIRGFERARDTTNDTQLMQLIMSGVSGTKAKVTDETIQSYIDAMSADIANARNREARRAVSGKTKKILESSVITLAHPLHPAVIAAIHNGDLQSALKLMAASSDPFIAKTAARFAAVNLNTKINVVDGLIDESGRPVPGLFHPETNTILIDSVTGMNGHVLLHEPGHAVTSHVLDNPNHPLTRQLQQVLDKIKDSLDTAYGATDVHEFAAEALSNPQFVGKLQSINPNGGVHTAWDMFARAVINFFRRMVGLESRPLASAYDEVDRILSGIISPSPEYRDAGALYAPTIAKDQQIFTGVNKLVRSVPVLNENQKAHLADGIKRAGKLTRSGIFSMLPTHALGEVAESVFPGLGMKFHNLINDRSGYQNDLNNKTDAVVTEAKAAIKAKPEQQKTFNAIANESTVYEVDPTKPMSEYKDPEDIKVWKDLNSRYNKLDKVWKDLYVTMRNAYKEMYEEVKKSINERIEETALDAGTKKRVRDAIMAKLSEKGMLDPYFALGREGEHWLAFNYKDKNGQMQRTQEAYKTDYERAARMEELQKLGATEVEPYEKVSAMNYRRAPTGSFMNSILQIMDTNGVPEKAVEETMRLFLATLPETAFAQSLQKRKGTPGYMDDTIGVFERKMRNTAHQVANMRFNPQLTNVVDEMQQKTVAAGVAGKGNQLEKDYVTEFEKHLKYVLNPTKRDLGSILASTAFTYTLGFNLSSAVVNMANVPMIVAPYLKGQYASYNVAGAIGNASKIFIGSGTNAEMEVLGANGRTTKTKVMPSILNYAKDSAIGRKYAKLIEIANKRGQLNRSQLYELINGDTRTGLLSKFNAMSGWMFHHGERMNREVTMIASFDLEMQKLAKDIKSGKLTQEEAETQAANNAVYTAELTNGSIAAASAPRVAQNPIGKLLFMYKRYGVSMYYMMFKTAKEAIDVNLPADQRKAAWRQLGGIVGMSALMAGAQGIPLFGLASMVYALFCDDDDDDLDNVTRKGLGEFLYKGPLEYFTNLSIASRITLNDLIVRDTKGGTSATTFTQQIGQAMGGPAFGIMDRIQRGYSKIAEGHLERGIEDMLPSALSNPLKGYRYATEGTNTLRGDPITGDINAWNVAAQAFGFAPADYTRQIELNAKEKGVDKYVVQKVSKLKQRYNLARINHDTEEMQNMREKLVDVGNKHTGLGINAGTVSEILSRSKTEFDKATKEMVHGVRYSKKMLKEIKSDSAEYEN